MLDKQIPYDKQIKTGEERMEFHEFQAIVEQIELVGKKFGCGQSGDDFTLWLTYQEPDIDTGEMEEQKTREWLISRHATPSSIARTALKCALTSAEHQVCEHFLFQGARVFSPHFNVEKLVDYVKQPDALG